VREEVILRASFLSLLEEEGLAALTRECSFFFFLLWPGQVAQEISGSACFSLPVLLDRWEEKSRE